MKVRASVKTSCEKCKVIRRKGVVRVICAANPRLRAGLVLAVEPMINIGTHETRTLGDGWTVVTRDGKYSAHFEHTIAVTETGPEVLTRP